MITYNEVDFNVVDNGDGTFTLSPVSGFSAADLIAEYREVREQTKFVLGHKQKLQALLTSRNNELVELRARRDALKTMLETAGQEPDSDEN